MAANPRQKGALGEELVRKLLTGHTGIPFERTPGSGNGRIKGDLHYPGRTLRYCIEIKNYAESPLSDKVFTSKTNNLVVWWNKLVKEAKGQKQLPLLFFRYNRSKIFVVTAEKPAFVNKFLYINWLGCYIMLSEEWLEKEEIEWLVS